MKKLRPIIDRPKYAKEIETLILSELKASIFDPIFDILAEIKAQLAQKPAVTLKTNAGPTFLEKAIVAGTVAYEGGYFIGTFTSAIRKELKALGAEWNKPRKAWKLATHNIPDTTKAAIVSTRARSSVALEQLNAFLDAAEQESIPEINFDEYTEKTLVDLDKQYSNTVTEELEIPLSMSGFIQDELKKEYTENMNLYIKKWHEEQIVRLREQVQENATLGFRASRLQDAIKAEYGVSANKARFLARQETSLLVSKYREETYKEAGVDQYQWSTSHDSRVRDTHKDLNGKFFRWDSPPIVDIHKGRRAHPGEDFGCRCVAIPIIRERK